MDGLELMWELRDRDDDMPLPVIIVTGEVDALLETELLEEGANDYIRKPVDPRLLLARVDATIRRAVG
jgi:DNA-binding response OmpR family regulator